MHGERFDVVLDSWPPPERLAGQDLHHSLCGIYELVRTRMTLTDEEVPPEITYELRDDEDYRRVRRAWSRYRMQRDGETAI